MNTLKSSMELSREVYHGFESHWRTDGIWRPSYSPEENEAIKTVAKYASAMGMKAYQDLAGNAYFILEGKNPDMPVFMTGSHVDAVPQGGRYDGTAGVVAGLGAIHLLQSEGRISEQDIVLTVIRSEESAWFNSALLGSRLACGDVELKILQNKRNHSDETLSSHMTKIGLNPYALAEQLQTKAPLIPLDNIGAFIEVHIEQGPSLLNSGHELGIVTGIRGNTRCPDMIGFVGQAAHSGATPQYMRRDAVLGAAKYITALDGDFRRKANTGADIVWSFPQIETPGGSPTTVPEFCRVRPEVRSLDINVLQWAKERMNIQARRTCINLGLGWDDKNLESPVIGQPSQMSPQIVKQLDRLCNTFNFEATKLPSGAGHDAGTFARYGVPSGMIFIPHGNGGISHNSGEIMALSEKDNPFSLSGGFSRAVRVLAEAMMDFPNTQNDPLKMRRAGREFSSGLSELNLS